MPVDVAVDGLNTRSMTSGVQAYEQLDGVYGLDGVEKFTEICIIRQSGYIVY
jgi:hypothetical protein